MPMVWNSNADAKLFAAVLKTTAVRLDYNALAAEMGPECTAKAITHRISNMKKTAGGGPTAVAASNGDGAPSTPKPRKTATSSTKSPKTPKTPTAKTPKSAAGSKRKSKAVTPADLGAVDDEDGLELKDEDDGGSPSKKLKAEPEEEDSQDELYMG